MVDARLSKAHQVQAIIEKFGNDFLGSSASKNMYQWVITNQNWIRTNVSSLLIPFFLYVNPSMQKDEDAASLRVALLRLLDKWILPTVKRAVDACVDPALLSQVLVRSLADVRKLWAKFTVASKFLMSPLESDTSKSSVSTIDRIFRVTFQESVFSVFRARLVASLLDLVTQVRDDPAKLKNVAGDAQELIKQFFDDLDSGADAAAAATPSVSTTAASQATDDVNSVTKKLSDFHTTVIEPYKAGMQKQYSDISRKYEAQNDLPGLLGWIPTARKNELELIRAMFHLVYPADFDMLRNNIIYEFDSTVASENALRLVNHNQFGVRHIFTTLPLDRDGIEWKAEGFSAEAKKADDASAPTPASPASTTGGPQSFDNLSPSILTSRLRDLFIVVSTAQIAKNMPQTVRTLPKNTTVKCGAYNSAGAAAKDGVNKNAKPATELEAFVVLKTEIGHHATNAIKSIVDSLRTSQQFASEKEYAFALCTALGKMLSRKDDIIKNLCDKDPEVNRAYANAFKHYINDVEPEPVFKRKRGDKVEDKKQRYPDIVAHYIDVALNKGDNDNNIEATADTAVELLSYVSDRDIFVEVYRFGISRRLLTKEFTDKLQSNENVVLSRLKSTLPANIVRKCGQGMMEDLIGSNSLVESFLQSKMADLGDDLTIAPRILGTMNWPQTKGPQGNIIWNSSLVTAQDTFTRWYMSKLQNRMLRWQYERGTAVMKISFPKAVKEISMTIIQANLLIHLDAKAPLHPTGGLNVAEIVHETGFKADDVECILMSMIGIGKNPQVVRVTGPNAATKKFDNNDRFGLNPDFVSKMKKMPLPAVPTKAGTDEADTVTDAAIMGWRTQQAQAVIVRIMKSKRELDNETLVRTAIEHLERSFKAQPAFLKKCIQELISKEYMERDENDMSIYRYKA